MIRKGARLISIPLLPATECGKPSSPLIDLGRRPIIVGAMKLSAPFINGGGGTGVTFGLRKKQVDGPARAPQNSTGLGL